jgi:hypothetical protein
VHVRETAVEEVLRDVDHEGLDTTGSEGLGDAVAHRACADHGDCGG